MPFRSWGKPIGREDELRELLATNEQAMLSALDGLDPEVVLSENEDVLIQALLGQHSPEEPQIQWAAMTRSAVEEADLSRPDPWERGQTIRVPGQRVVFRAPVVGAAVLLTRQASTFSSSSPQASVVDGIVFIVIEAQDPSPEVVTAELHRRSQAVEQHATWIASDLRNWRTVMTQRLSERLSMRKQRLLAARALDAALDVPVTLRADALSAVVPARRKAVSLQTRQSQARFVPEPVLDEASYRDILKMVQAWATGLERSPDTVSKLDEEGLRDHLLITLNAHWEGRGGGELFNGAGKTDLLIRENNRNVFIGECKIWSGARAAGEALDQLLTYLVWRDSKAALIFFIRNKHPLEVLGKLNAAIEAHPSHCLTLPAADPTALREHVITADAEGRRVSLAVVQLALPR